MTNADINFPVESLYSNYLEEIAQASGGATTITINFDTPQTMNSYFIGYHNLSNFIITLYDEFSAVLYTDTFTPDKQSIRKYITTVLNVARIELTLAASSAVFLGSFSCGIFTQLYNIVVPFNIQYVNTSKFEQTDGGQVLHRVGRRLAAFDINLAKNTDEQAEAFEEAYDEVLSGKTFWLDRNEDLDSRQPMFVFFDGDLSTSDIDEFIDLTTSVREAK